MFYCLTLYFQIRDVRGAFNSKKLSVRYFLFTVSVSVRHFFTDSVSVIYSLFTDSVSVRYFLFRYSHCTNFFKLFIKYFFPLQHLHNLSFRQVLCQYNTVQLNTVKSKICQILHRSTNKSTLRSFIQELKNSNLWLSALKEVNIKLVGVPISTTEMSKTSTFYKLKMFRLIMESIEAVTNKSRKKT